jgi:hypothetical protein
MRVVVAPASRAMRCQACWRSDPGMGLVDGYWNQLVEDAPLSI